MLLNEYYCDNCAQTFQALTPSSGADTRPTCPRCQSQNTARRISGAAAATLVGSDDAPGSAGSCSNAGGRFT